MYLKFYEIFNGLIENVAGGDDSAVGSAIFTQYNLMYPKTPLEWTVSEGKNYNQIIRTCITILTQRLSYFDDLYFNYQIVDTSVEELYKYINPIMRTIKRHSLGMVSDILNWSKKKNYINEANINELNDFLSSTTRTSTQPYAKDANNETIWSSETKTNRNIVMFDIPEDKWNEFGSFVAVYKEISTILYNIFRR